MSHEITCKTSQSFEAFNMQVMSMTCRQTSDAVMAIIINFISILVISNHAFSPATKEIILYSFKEHQNLSHTQRTNHKPFTGKLRGKHILTLTKRNLLSPPTN